MSLRSDGNGECQSERKRQLGWMKIGVKDTLGAVWLGDYYPLSSRRIGFVSGSHRPHSAEPEPVHLSTVMAARDRVYLRHRAGATEECISNRGYSCVTFLANWGRACIKRGPKPD